MDMSTILELRQDDTSAETEFCLSVKWTGPSNSAGVTVQSTVGSQGMCVSWYCAGQAMFCSSMMLTGYPPHSVISLSLPHPCVVVCHLILISLYSIVKTLKELPSVKNLHKLKNGKYLLWC